MRHRGARRAAGEHAQRALAIALETQQAVLLACAHQIGDRSVLALIEIRLRVAEELLELARWIGTYYCCPIETVMRSMLPQVIRRAEIGWKKQLSVQPRRKIDSDELEKLRKRAPRQAELPSGPAAIDNRSPCKRKWERARAQA